MKKNIFKSNGFQSLLASLLCIVLGLFLGYLVLLVINPAGAGEAILTVVKNFLTYKKTSSQLKYLGNTLVKTAPLLMCSLSILFAYKVGLFNIGAAGQYCFGVALSLYAALGLGWSWLPCLLVAMAGGAVLGAISGVLKSYCNVNEVISGIMLNWIVLYLTNMLLTTVKEAASPYTIVLANNNPSAVLPSLGLGALFNKNQYVGLAIPLSIVMAILIWIVLDKTRFGYELKATGFNRNAAKYCGMAEKRNVILSLVISGALAGMGAALLYLTGYEQWQCSTSSVPAMGFNGIAAAFLGGLNPLGTVLASFFIQHITAGGAYVDKSLYCAQISDLISSIIIYLCGFVLFMKHVFAAAIYPDLCLRADPGGSGRLLLRALRRDQSGSGGHHDHGRSGRRSDDALSGREQLSFCDDPGSGAGFRRGGHGVFLPAGCGLHQLQGRSDVGRHSFEPAGHRRGHRHCQGHQHCGQSR